MAARPVVVGVDGSEESLSAVEWAATAARLHDAPLRIVAAPPAAPRLYAIEAHVPVINALRGLAARALGAALLRAQAASSDLDISTVLLDGLVEGRTPFAVAAAGTDAAMLVIGARGCGGFPAMTLGSVSSYAATHASCPVVVVRAVSEPRRREIVVGIQDAGQSSDALAFALDEARARDAELTAIHAWSWFRDDLSHPDEQAPAKASAKLADALDPWRDKYPGVRLRSEIVRGHPAWVLASYSACAELVVLGRSAADGGRGLTSIQHAVLDHARGPIAIVPESRPGPRHPQPDLGHDHAQDWPESRTLLRVIMKRPHSGG